MAFEIVNDNIVTLDTFVYSNKDYILIRYNFGKISCKDLHNICKMTQMQFPNSTLIALPNDISIENCGRKTLNDVYNAIGKELGKENNIDVGQTVYVITQRRKSSPYEVVECTVDRKTVKKRKSFSVSGRYNNSDYYNGTFVESSINRNVFLIKDQADYECERLNNKWKINFLKENINIDAKL